MINIINKCWYIILTCYQSVRTFIQQEFKKKLHSSQLCFKTFLIFCSNKRSSSVYILCYTKTHPQKEWFKFSLLVTEAAVILNFCQARSTHVPINSNFPNFQVRTLPIGSLAILLSFVLYNSDYLLYKLIERIEFLRQLLALFQKNKFMSGRCLSLVRSAMNYKICKQINSNVIIWNQEKSSISFLQTIILNFLNIGSLKENNKP